MEALPVRFTIDLPLERASSLLRRELEREGFVVAGSVQDDGAVPGVAVPPGGPGVPFGTTLFGQGFFLLAAHALRGELGI